MVVTSVSAWLGGLGLTEYVPAFAENDVDASTLPTLTETDLIEIGVTSVGHRRKLTEAIAILREGPLAAGSRAGLAQSGEVPAQAEHRQISVLYSDMVGSTALSARLDPEDYREVIRSFHQTCVRTVVEYDGWVANFIGDCVLAYFGWPRAHEDDPERAVRAGLAIVRAVANSGVKVRTGIATGLVVVGDLVRTGPAQEHSAVGATPTLAAWLQSLAEPGQVVMDELTHQLTPTFAARALGAHEVQGLSQPMSAYGVIEEHQAESRFDSRKGAALAPMVGRDAELGLLLERWRRACGGEGHAVFMEGEAGIGKSRLVRALLDACAQQPHVVVRWQCSPYHGGSALWPVIQRLSRAAGLLELDSAEQALDKLEAAVDCGGEAGALYAKLLGLDGKERYGALQMSPPMLRERTLALLVAKLRDMAGQQPLLLLIEDAHWIDPSSLELVERCLEQIESARILALITSRPDNQPKLAACNSATRLSLNRLSRASSLDLIGRLGGVRLNPQTRATIVAQADGVPLFVEELTKAVLETGETAIPASLHGSLMARLDRVPETMEVAQIAACIGREFDLALVQAVAERPEAVHAALERLVAAELVFRRGDQANTRFAFKHALVQEAAYQSLLRSARRSIHGRILQSLEGVASRPAPEILAHHAERAQHGAKATEYWRKAGNAAVAKCAYAEAAGFFEAAVAQIQGQGGSADLQSLELDLHLRLGQARMAIQGMGSQAAGEAFEHAAQLSKVIVGAPSRIFEVQHWLWTYHFTRGSYRETDSFARQALASAQVERDDGLLQFAHRLVAESCMIRGEFVDADEHSQQAMALLKPQGGPLFGVPPDVTYCHRSWLLQLRGQFEQSRCMLEQMRQSIAMPVPAVVKVHIELSCAMQCAFARNFAAMRKHAESVASVAERHRLTMHHAYASALQAWADLEDGRAPRTTLLSLNTALAQLARTETRLLVPYLMAPIATALARCGEKQEAIQTIASALTACETTNQLWCYAELWRVRGELQLVGPDADCAEAARCFERALSDARQRGAKAWELHAAISSARLLKSQGQRDSAMDVLAPVYGTFTEGFDTIDLLEAKALLNELHPEVL